MSRISYRAWAVVACGSYLALAALAANQLPFVCFPVFAFPAFDHEAAVPYFAVDGTRDQIDRYDAFYGIGGDDVDVDHRPYPSSVLHMFYEMRSWIASHPGVGDRTGTRPCSVGITIVSIAADGTVVVHDRVDADGACRLR